MANSFTRGLKILFSSDFIFKKKSQKIREIKKVGLDYFNKKSSKNKIK